MTMLKAESSWHHGVSLNSMDYQNSSSSNFLLKESTEELLSSHFSKLKNLWLTLFKKSLKRERKKAHTRGLSLRSPISSDTKEEVDIRLHSTAVWDLLAALLLVFWSSRTWLDFASLSSRWPRQLIDGELELFQSWACLTLILRQDTPEHNLLWGLRM